MTFLDRIKETSTSTGTGTFTLSGAVTGYKVFSNGTYKYCIVNETESEWEVGEGTVASGVLTRITIEASSNGGAAVSFSAGTKFVFNTVSAAYVNSLVPYTGATAAVNLGAYGLTSDYLQLSTTPTASGAVGRTIWNDTIGSTQTTLKGGSVVLKNGVDLVARVVNKVTPAATLTKATYKAVRVSGAQGQRLAIAYAQANTDNNSADTIGLVCETIAQNQEGFIITVGQLTGINTTGSLQGETWADGDVLYLSPTTAGNLTNIKPTGATGHIVVIGYVEYAHANNGSIYVKIMNGWELDELHNVYINAVANNDVLVYDSSSTLWKNKSIATILGYTPQAAITLTTTGSSGASTFVSNTLNIPTYTLAGLGGISLTSLSASAPLSYNNTTGIFSIAQATGSVNGFLSSTDWTTFNNKQAAITLTTTSTSGAATFASNTLNIPQYQGALTLTTTGTSGAATLVGNTLNIPQYSGGGITGSGTAGQVTYWSGTSAVTGSSNLVWDNTNARLGIGTSSPISSLETYSNSIYIAGAFSMYSNTATDEPIFYFRRGRGTLASPTVISAGDTIGSLRFAAQYTATIGSYNTNAKIESVAEASGANLRFYTNTGGFSTSPTLKLQINGNGNVIIQNGGTFTDGGQRLQVIGSMRVGSTAASAMYWDDTNNRLGIGTSSPTRNLHIIGATNSRLALEATSSFVGIDLIRPNNSQGNSFNYFTSTTADFLIGQRGGHSDFVFYSYGTSGDIARFYRSTGNFQIQNGGTFTDAGYRLDVQGTMRATGQVRLSGLPTSATGLSAGDLWNNLGIVSIV